MTSDLAPESTKPSGQSPKETSGEILKNEIREARDAFGKGSFDLFMSGLSAGLDLGFSVLLMAVMWTQTHDRFPQPVVHMLIANMYSVGFIFVVIGRSELFTEQTTLAIFPVLDRRTSILKLLKLWATVYVANIIGSVIFARLATWMAPALGDATPASFSELAHEVIDHGNIELILSAIFAGWLMGLLSWLVAAGRDTISQIVIVWMITTAIGFAGLHHAIAGAIELFSGAFAHGDISIMSIVRVLFFTTIGNILGGVIFVAVIKYGHAKRGLIVLDESEDQESLFGKYWKP